MLEFLRKLVAGVVEAWRRLTISARVQIALAGLLTLALIAGAVFFGAQPQYARLYDRLDPSESNEIVVWLADSDISYRIRQGGSAIDVPVRDIPQARIGLAALNLPKSQGIAPGFEIFNDRDLMSNRFLQDVDYMRAIQGELQRMLNQFDFVRKSFVFIREAPEQLFVSDQRPSQATVILDTTGLLTDSQVKAVVHTVSSFGGANLSSKNIAVSTSDGTILHSPSEDEFASLANEKLGVQVALERERENKIRKIFDNLGVNAVISVSALMDWTSEERRTLTVTEGTVISSLISESSTQNIEQPPEGAPGAIANIPSELGRPGGTGTTTEDSEIIENFDPSETVTSTTTPPGTVQKYLISAFIEGTYTPVVGDDGVETGETAYQALSDDDIDRYRAFILNAVGPAKEPTDIAIYDHPFRLDRITAVQVSLAVPVLWWQIPMLQWGLQFAAMVIALLLIRFLMRRAMVMPAEEEEELVELPEVSAAELRRQEIASEVERLSMEEPEMVAALLRSWIAEED